MEKQEKLAAISTPGFEMPNSNGVCLVFPVWTEKVLLGLNPSAKEEKNWVP